MQKLRFFVFMIFEYLGIYFGWITQHQGVRNVLSFYIVANAIIAVLLCSLCVAARGLYAKTQAGLQKHSNSSQWQIYFSIPVIAVLVYKGALLLGAIRLLGLLSLYIIAQIAKELNAGTA